jgi:hypothetical protein
MAAADSPHDYTHANLLLLEHAAALERLEGRRPGAFERLEEVIGFELARRLVDALAGSSRARPLELVG